MVTATLRTAIGRLVDADLDHVSLRAEASAVLRRHLGFDIAVWATVDPVTVVWTHCLLDGADRDHELERRTFENEFTGNDVCSLSSLLTSKRQVGTIDRATDGDPAKSTRYRDLMQPIGIRDELRAVLAEGDTPWGALHLLRADRPFDTTEIDAVAEITRPLADALRRVLLTTAAREPARLDDPPGVIEVDADGAIASTNTEARSLLDSSDAHDVPQVVHAVVAARRAGRPPIASLATPGGPWLSFVATTIGVRTVVIVEPVRPRRLADIIVRSHGLTTRERQVVEHLAKGSSTRRIAQGLSISEWTVQDHLKAIFAKFGVASRSELMAAVFFGYYLPMHDAGATPSPRGWYLADQSSST